MESDCPDIAWIRNKRSRPAAASQSGATEIAVQWLSNKSTRCFTVGIESWAIIAKFTGSKFYTVRMLFVMLCCLFSNFSKEAAPEACCTFL
jgi:hypothetical protein